MARTVPQGIKLNVGGMAFESTKETLCKSGHLRTFFDLADGVEEGIPFIDRCPVRFAAVLRALRSNKLRARDSHEFEELQDEFAYFGISDEVQLLPPVRKEQMVVYERCEIWCFGESYPAESICKLLSDGQGWEVRSCSIAADTTHKDASSIIACVLERDPVRPGDGTPANGAAEAVRARARSRSPRRRG